MRKHSISVSRVRNDNRGTLTPIRYRCGGYTGYGTSQAEALADLATRILFRSPFLK